MGSHTEIVFVEGHSTDDTLGRCLAEAASSVRDITVLTQSGRGKGDAVRLGFTAARGDILMILDADMTVPPEDLPQFYDALVANRGDFINGSRLVYGMDRAAMRFLNLLGNRAFAALLSWLLGQQVKDTLCGTKVLWRSSYRYIAENRGYFSHLDPFGDFDLLFGAAKLALRIVEVPIRYRERIYGRTNISRFRDGWKLLRLCADGARKLRFVG
jgi:glycosyltransferase involved in cell wall biosynthesis